ncbi:MAG: 2-phospho-L-lactate transferase [Neisseriales bacterium]|nr:MAG: 2-phospho-L-lactate transferase [Neisseriales bacterium]
MFCYASLMMNVDMPHVVLLAGGSGGARMAKGLAHTLPAEYLTVISNVADDETFYGLYVSPDTDSLLYTLCNRINKQGWGISGDRYRAQNMLKQLGLPVWMELGDSDLGMHIWRSLQLSQGKNLTEVTLEAAQYLQAKAKVLPATNDKITTTLTTANGSLCFQEWFVRERCLPSVLKIDYIGITDAQPSLQILSALEAAHLIILAPSNPWLSIEPILNIPMLRDRLHNRKVPCVAVSPLVGQRAIKGPLVKLMTDLALPVTIQSIAKQYQSMIDWIVIDRCDQQEKKVLQDMGLQVLVTDIVIPTIRQAIKLAKQLIELPNTQHI